MFCKDLVSFLRSSLASRCNDSMDDFMLLFFFTCFLFLFQCVPRELKRNTYLSFLRVSIAVIKIHEQKQLYGFRGLENLMVEQRHDSRDS